MSIPASQIVQVNPRLLTPGGADLEFNGLLLSESPLIPSSQVLPFPDPESVGAYFGLESPEYEAAVVYFLGYNNSFKKPRALYVASRVAEARAAWLRGGPWSGTLAELKSAGLGGLSLTVNGEKISAQMSFATATSYSDVARILQFALNEGATPGTPARAAVLTGGDITFASLADVTDGAFAIEVNGEARQVTGLDLSAITSPLELATALSGKIAGVEVSAGAGGIVLSTTESGGAASIGYATAPGEGDGADVSALLALTADTGARSVAGADATPGTGVAGITVAYSSLTGGWIIQSPTTGAGSTITYAQAPETGADFAALLNLTEQAGAVVSPGMDAMSPAANMEALLDLTKNFVCFTTVAQPDEAEALALAQWASGKGAAYLYIYWDNDPKLLQPNNTATIAAALKEANVGATCGVWDSLAYAAMIMGTAASIDWERRNGTITFAFKGQDGLPANVVTGTDATNLTAQGMNFMGDYATRNDQFIFLYPGRMFGSWTWIDAYLNAVWLNNALQVACMAGFEQTPRVPYNSEGYALVRAWMQDPVNRALYSGIIDTGVTLSESQKAELTREAGRDISGELFTDGYVIQVNDPAPAVRQQRESPECSVFYTYGGSVHKLTIATTTLA